MRFISGMVMAPVVMTLETDEPLMVPNRPEVTTATFAGPPAKRPAAAAPRLENSRPVPEPAMKEPNTMKAAMVVATMPVSGPYTPPAVGTSQDASRISAGVKTRVFSTPGRRWPNCM